MTCGRQIKIPKKGKSCSPSNAGRVPAVRPRESAGDCQRIQAEHLASEVHVQRRARAECTLSMQSPHRSRMRRPVLELPCRGLHAERGGIDGSWRMT